MEFIANRIADCKECGRGVYDSREQVMVDKRGRCEDCCTDLRCSEKGCENLAHIDSENEFCAQCEYNGWAMAAKAAFDGMLKHTVFGGDGNSEMFALCLNDKEVALAECKRWLVHILAESEVAA